MDDHHYIELAVRLARRCAPRPLGDEPQGCVIVKEDGSRIVARGWNGDGKSAMTRAVSGNDVAHEGASSVLYFAREPYADEVDEIVAFSPARIVMGQESATERWGGKGIEELQKAGIEVDVGRGRDHSRKVLAAHDHVRRTGRPFVTLKLASSVDGRIATKSGESKWITGNQARRFVHLLRAEADAIMVGSNTAVADNPDLTCRLEGLEACSPLRIVVDSRIRTPLTHNVIATAKAAPTLFIVGPERDKDRERALEASGVSVLEVGYAKEPGFENLLDMEAALTALAGSGIADLFVEGGAALAATLMRRGLIDRVFWVQGPKIIGGDGKAALAPMGFEKMKDIVSLAHRRTYRFDDDIAVEYDVR